MPGEGKRCPGQSLPGACRFPEDTFPMGTVPSSACCPPFEKLAPYRALGLSHGNKLVNWAFQKSGAHNLDCVVWSEC